MIGGIFCESNLGAIYEEKTLMSVRQRFRQLVGNGDIVPHGDTLTEQIVNHFYDEISQKMGKVLSSWKPPANRGYYNRTVDLTRSICLGIYNRGKLRRMYRFTGGHREKGLFSPSDLGTNPSSSTPKRFPTCAKKPTSPIPVWSLTKNITLPLWNERQKAQIKRKAEERSSAFCCVGDTGYLISSLLETGAAGAFLGSSSVSTPFSYLPSIFSTLISLTSNCLR